MNRKFVFFLVSVLFFSCSSRKQLIYISDLNSENLNRIKYSHSKLEVGDILSIDVKTTIPEVSSAYKNVVNSASNENIMKIDGYIVNSYYNINYPILGEINVKNLSEEDLSQKITKLLVDEGHLKNPFVKVKCINSKFTVLGEVNNPGTFTNYEKNLNIFQALGYAGDLLITAKREDITLIREENGLRKTIKISLKDAELLGKSYYYIKNNDVIIVEPNYSKIKSAGFIGSPETIASISSLLLSITLLIINR